MNGLRKCTNGNAHEYSSSNKLEIELLTYYNYIFGSEKPKCQHMNEIAIKTQNNNTTENWFPRLTSVDLVKRLWASSHVNISKTKTKTEMNFVFW